MKRTQILKLELYEQLLWLTDVCEEVSYFESSGDYSQLRVVSAFSALPVLFYSLCIAGEFFHTAPLPLLTYFLATGRIHKLLFT